MKPIEVVAARGNRGAIEILFLLSSKVESIPNWTVDGTSIQQDGTRNRKETDLSKEKLPKEDLPEVSLEAKKKAAETKAQGHDA